MFQLHANPRKTAPSAVRPSLRAAQARALAKAISWRLFGTAATSALWFALTARWDLALTIGGAESLAKIGLYFVHERLWDRIAFGHSHRRPRQ